MSMNKKTMNKVKKFITVKRGDEGSVRIKSINNYMIGSGGTINKLNSSVSDMDSILQDMYIKNIRKVVSGKWKEKTFDEDFLRTLETGEEGADRIGFDLMYSLYEEDITPDQFARIIAPRFSGEEFLLLSILRVETDYEDEEFNYNTMNQYFITVNNVKDITPNLLYEGGNKLKVDIQNALEVKLTTPIFGCMYPSIDGPSINVNSITLYLKSVKERSMVGNIEELFDVDLFITVDDKENFFELIKEVVGEELTPEELGTIYYELFSIRENDHDYNEEGEMLINRHHVNRIIKAIGVEDKEVDEELFDEYAGENKGFDIDAIVKDRNVQVKVGESSTINIDPLILGNLKKQNIDGKEYVILETGGSLNADGFNLK